MLEIVLSQMDILIQCMKYRKLMGHNSSIPIMNIKISLKVNLTL